MNVIQRCKICRVCGDRATGFNNGGLANCEPCKIFFHRYSICGLKKFKCKNNGQCEINLENRQKCRRCRLEKCFSIGMIRKQHNSSIDLENINLNVITSENDAENCLLEVLFTKTPTFLISPFSEINSITCGNRATKLTDYENSRIKEILSASSVMVDEGSLPIVKKGENIYDGFRNLEFYFESIIKFCREISAFNLLTKDDQFVTLKPFCFDILLIRFATAMNFEKGGFPVIIDKSAKNAIFIPFNPSSMSTIVKNNFQSVIETYEFSRTLQRELENDPLIKNLLIALCLFKNQIKTSNPEYIRYNFLLYSRLLQRFLEEKYGSIQQARKKLTTLMELVMQFPKMRECERTYLKELDIQRLPHLFIELYSLF